MLDQGSLNFGKVKPPTKEDQERAFLKLVEHRRGKAAGILASEVASILNWTIRSTRATAARIVAKGFPVYGSKRPPYGYFVMVTPDEFALAFDEGYASAMSILRRVSKYRKIGAVDLGGQITIDLEGGTNDPEGNLVRAGGPGGDPGGDQMAIEGPVV
jgi:hypothetical protein